MRGLDEPEKPLERGGSWGLRTLCRLSARGDFLFRSFQHGFDGGLERAIYAQIRRGAAILELPSIGIIRGVFDRARIEIAAINRPTDHVLVGDELGFANASETGAVVNLDATPPVFGEIGFNLEHERLSELYVGRGRVVSRRRKGRAVSEGQRFPFKVFRDFNQEKLTLGCLVGRATSPWLGLSPILAFLPSSVFSFLPLVVVFGWCERG